MKTEVIDAEDVDVPIKQLIIRELENEDEEKEWGRINRKLIKPPTLRDLKMSRLEFLQNIGDLTLQKKNLTDGYFKSGELSNKLGVTGLKIPEKIKDINRKFRQLFDDEDIIEVDETKNRFRLRIFMIIEPDGSEIHFFDEYEEVFNRMVFKEEHRKMLDEQTTSTTKEISTATKETKQKYDKLEAQLSGRLEILEKSVDSVAYLVSRIMVFEDFPARSEDSDIIYEFARKAHKMGKTLFPVGYARGGLDSNDKELKHIMTNIIPFLIDVSPQIVDDLKKDLDQSWEEKIADRIERERKKYRIDKEQSHKIKGYFIRFFKNELDSI